MDTLYSLRTRSDSFDSVGSFAVLTASDPRERRRQSAANRDAESSDSGEYDDDEWEVLSDDSNQLEERHDTVGAAAASTMMMTSVVVYDRYFDTASMPPRPTEADEQPECEHESPDRHGALDSCTFLASVEPPLAATARPAPLSPSSKSRHAREVLYCTVDERTPTLIRSFFLVAQTLKAFYLTRARQTEARCKLLVLHPPLPARPLPLVQRTILPLKAPDRYSVAVREDALRTANALKATAALQQFRQARELAKKQRAALNRSNEAQLIQSQSGRGVALRRPSH